MPALPGEQINLPTKKRDLALVIDRHATREMTRCMPMYTLWRLAYYYMKGYRRFDTFSPNTGRVEAYIADDDGKLGFQSQKMLTMINEVADTLGEMDVRPAIARSDDSLTSIKDRAVTQILADAITPESHLDEVKSDFMYNFVTYGMCGLTGDITTSRDIGLTASYTAIHPRELLPFPSQSEDFTKSQGLMRQRTIPLDVLVDKLGSSIKSDKVMNQLEVYEIDIGEAYHDPYSYGSDQNGPWGSLHHAFDEDAAPYGSKHVGKKGKQCMYGVRVREVWMHEARDTVRRYSAASGEYLLEDLDYRGNEPPRTIGYGRFLNNGTWHGAGLFHVLFSMHREFEKLLRDLFQNIREVDKYGVLVMPAGEFNERNLLREIEGGPKVISYRQDAMYDQSSFKPFGIEPHNSGEIPGKAALLADGLLRQLNPIADLAANKGRVDSASGLQMLEEEGRKKLRRPLKEASRAFGTVHRYLTGKAIFESIANDQPFPVSKLRTEMAGAVVNFKDETVRLSENNIPRIHRLTFTVRDEAPRNREVRKQNAMNIARDYFAEDGVTDTDALKLWLISQGHDVEMWLEEEKAAYHTVVRNILMLYGDGDQNEQVIVSPHTAKPALQLRVLQAFMAGIEFNRASPRVQNDFVMYRQQLMAFMGNVLAGAVRNPDDYAAAVMMKEQQMGEVEPSGLGAPAPLPFPGAQVG